MILYKTKESEIVRVDGSSSGQSLKKYSTIITGDGAKTVFTIEHNLDTEDIIFEMNDKEGLIFTDYNVADNNTVNIIFSIAPLTEEKYSVTIYGVNGSSNGSGGNNSSSTSPVISGVSGIKGSAESEFRTGDVTISPQDLGLDADTYAKKSIYVLLSRKTVLLLVKTLKLVVFVPMQKAIIQLLVNSVPMLKGMVQLLVVIIPMQKAVIQLLVVIIPMLEGVKHLQQEIITFLVVVIM